MKFIDTKNQLADILTKKEISHVMGGIISRACSISAISVLQCVLIQWRNDLNTIQEGQQSQGVINDLDNVFFLQRSNLLIRKLCCMCLKITKQ